MSSRLNLKLVTAGALAIAAVSFPAFASAAGDRAAATTEFSAQTKEDPKNKAKVAPKNVTPKQAPARVAPRQVPQHVAPRTVAPRVTPQSGGPKNIGAQKKLAPKTVAPVTTTPRIVGPNTSAPKTARRAFTPRGANSNVVRAANIRGVPARGAGRTTIAGRNYSVWRSGYRVRRGGGWRTFVALGALGVIAIGAYEYYPYAYIEAPEPYCDGRTADGCQLVWDEVETMEGDAIGQCVAYCQQ